MNELPQERLIVAVHAQAMIERALALTIDYVKQRKAFGKAIIEFQNTQFVLAECKTEATIARVFHDHCVERYLDGELDTATASMAKYWLTDLQGKIIDRCLQLFGGYGYMDEYPISRMYRDARVHAHLCGHQRDHEGARSRGACEPPQTQLQEEDNVRRLHLRPRAHAARHAARPTARCTR